MVTIANRKTIEVLNLELADARRKLEQLEGEQSRVEGKIFSIKEAITDVLIKLETEALPTGLYNRGYKLQEREHKFILSDYDGEEVYSFNHVPTLGDLMDIEHQYIKQG